MGETPEAGRAEDRPLPGETPADASASTACAARVVDTNVLIVASAADEGSPFPSDLSAVQSAGLREQVLDWLVAFEADPAQHAVLDWDWLICGEYQNKLSEQDYGWLALMHKLDRNEVLWVGLETDANGHARLPPALAAAVTDLADRKMVAAALQAGASGRRVKLTNACDTDWLVSVRRTHLEPGRCDKEHGVHQKIGGHVDTLAIRPAAVRSRRRHDEAFKARIIEACERPGVSVAAVALANGLNANLVRRWVATHRARLARAVAEALPAPSRSAVPAFVPLPMPTATRAAEAGIRIELQGAALRATVTWPIAAADDCAAWLRAVLG